LCDELTSQLSEAQPASSATPSFLSTHNHGKKLPTIAYFEYLSIYPNLLPPSRGNIEHLLHFAISFPPYQINTNMPFDYDKYQARCNGMSTEELQKEWENYTRQMSSGATSTATSILFMPLTGGISVVGVGLSAPRIHNARKKREIIEAGLKARGTTHHTRTADVLAPMAVSGIIGGLTLGLVPPGVDSAAGVAAGRGIEIAATNTALNAGEAILIDKARKKAASEANAQSQAQNERFGIMATPFLIHESVLEQFVQQPAQASTASDRFETTAIVPQVSSTPVGVTDAHPPTILRNDQDQPPADPLVQSTHDQPQPTTDDASLFTSIPSHK
jgi:hypothetical protein